MNASSGVGILGVIYLIIGGIVAANTGYFTDLGVADWNSTTDLLSAVGNFLEGVLAILLWPLIPLAGADFHSLLN